MKNTTIRSNYKAETFESAVDLSSIEKLSSLDRTEQLRERDRHREDGFLLKETRFFSSRFLFSCVEQEEIYDGLRI